VLARAEPVSDTVLATVADNEHVDLTELLAALRAELL
jgi:hypothetical protein